MISLPFSRAASCSLALVTAVYALAEGPAKGRPATDNPVVVIDRITASRALPDGIELHANLAVLEVTALRDDVLRVRVGAHGALPEDGSWAVLPGSRMAKVKVTPDNAGGAIGFSTAKLHVKIER